MQSAAFSSDGSILIVGCVSGKWLVMDSETREIYSVHTDGSEPIQVSNTQYVRKIFINFFILYCLFFFSKGCEILT